VESWHVVVGIVIAYAIFILLVASGKWTRVGRVAMDDYFKVAPGFGFVVLYLGMAGGFHTAFAIPGSMGFYYRHGVAFAANVLWTVSTPLAIMYFFGTRITCLGRRFNYVTPTDLFVDYFGEGKFRAFLSLYILSCSVPLMTANITGPARLLSGGTEGNISYLGALVIIGALVTVYLWTGGMRGLTWTTVAQAVWMFLAVWGAGIWCLFLLQGDSQRLFTAAANTSPDLLTLPGPEGLATLQWWLSFPLSIALHWAILPRAFLFFYSARSVDTVRKISLSLGFYLMLMYVPAMIIGFTARAFFPDLPGSQADQAFPLMMAQYAPAWFAGIIIAGGLAAGMSSLDADTNANSAMLTKDIYSNYAKRQADAHYVRVGRFFVVGLILLTVLVAMNDWGLVVLMVGLSASMITQLIPALIAVTVPMRRSFTKAGVTAGILAGLIVSLATRFYPIWGFDPALWGFVVNVPVTIIVSRFTSPPDPEAVARIRGALAEEFGRGRRKVSGQALPFPGRP
jgi:SSS family solute:Na+ symporter